MLVVIGTDYIGSFVTKNTRSKTVLTVIVLIVEPFEFNNLQFLSQNDNSFKASCVDTTRHCQLAFHQAQSYTNLAL
jgi:hypothetical protein